MIDKIDELQKELINKRDGHKFVFSRAENECEKRYQQGQIDSFEYSINRLNEILSHVLKI